MHNINDVVPIDKFGLSKILTLIYLLYCSSKCNVFSESRNQIEKCGVKVCM